MSAQSIPTNAKHIGYAVCEFAQVIVPVASTYARKDAAERAIRRAVEDAHGCEVTEVELYPASMHEEVRELIDYASVDSEGYTYLVEGLIVVQPDAAREQAAAELAAELDRAISTADGLIAVLASKGYAAAYSKGGNVWCDAPAGSTDAEALGLKWSAKRGQWWCKPADACEDREASRCKPADFRRAREEREAPKAA